MMTTTLQNKARQAAIKYFESKDYDLLDELDGAINIVAIDNEDDSLVFVSVTASTDDMPEEDPDRHAFEEAAAAYLVANCENLPADMSVRFDAVCLHILSDNRALLRHHVNALGSVA